MKEDIELPPSTPQKEGFAKRENETLENFKEQENEAIYKKTGSKPTK